MERLFSGEPSWTEVFAVSLENTESESDSERSGENNANRILSLAEKFYVFLMGKVVLFVEKIVHRVSHTRRSFVFDGSCRSRIALAKKTEFLAVNEVLGLVG